MRQRGPVCSAGGPAKPAYGRSAVDHHCLVLDKGRRHGTLCAAMDMVWRGYPSRTLAITRVPVSPLWQSEARKHLSTPCGHDTFWINQLTRPASDHQRGELVRTDHGHPVI